VQAPTAAGQKGETYMFGTILFWIIFGGVTGWIASIIIATNEEQGSTANIIIGILGAVIGGFIFRMFGGSGVTGFNLYSIIVAVIGAAMLLAIVRSVSHFSSD
jgi:uncharacterized membrane protein YeaQ/YmgE (transglycosylase-associated protein family)